MTKLRALKRPKGVTVSLGVVQFAACNQMDETFWDAAELRWPGKTHTACHCGYNDEGFNVKMVSVAATGTGEGQ
ncbi:hypothetical protein BDN67DRAFT_371095 [Paxillus ammoniavirescens]|nr:hypothetical protein BDN67DRAFT_371095 [Paxillus ammoniavirescens]